MNLEEYYIQIGDDAIEWCGEDDSLYTPQAPLKPPAPPSEFKTADEIMSITRGMC